MTYKTYKEIEDLAHKKHMHRVLVELLTYVASEHKCSTLRAKELIVSYANTPRIFNYYPTLKYNLISFYLIFNFIQELEIN